MHLRLAILACGLLAFAGCAQFPAPKGTRAADLQSAAFPKLLSFDALDQAKPPAPPVVDPADELAARAAALRARAANLRNQPAG